jgi:hypothetical protein
MRPTVYLPNSMVRTYPIRPDEVDDQIRSFPLTISSYRNTESFSIMPGDRNGAAYDQEKTTPYYYSAHFSNSGIRTERSGYFRFTFPSGKASLTLANRMSGSLRALNGKLSTGQSASIA